MFFRTIHLELPRRVVAYFLLFGTAAVTWLAVNVVVISQSSLSSRREGFCLAQLGRASAAVVLDFLRNGEANLQSLAERFESEGSLAYCAIVSRDGRFLAHSSRELVGQVHTEPAAEHVQWGEIERIQFRDSNSQRISEYRVPLCQGDEVFGTLHMAVPEPSVWGVLGSTVRDLPMVALGPLLCLALGAAMLQRMVRPLAEIETQLQRVAIAPSPAGVELRDVKVRSPAAAGWNRVVDEYDRNRRCSSFDQRLSKAVEELHQREADGILNSLPDGLAVADDERRITFANRALAAMLGNGADSSPLGGKTMEACLGLEGQVGAASVLLNPELGGRTVTAEIKRSSDGSERVFRVARHPLRTADRRSSEGHVWSVRDISQQKLVEQARDQFLDTASHELRTPLANLKAYAETLSLSEGLDVESQKAFCNTINSEATRLARLIDDLLSISSMEVGSLSLARQETDVERVFREVVKKVDPQMAQKGITFESVFPEKWPMLHLDKDKFSTALVNLLGNAAKYTPNGGRVTLRVKTRTQLKIAVEDTGVGISADELPKVFDKFFRSSDPRVQEQTGSGLGLSLTHEVIRMHDGTLTVESELNVGSKFIITLPIN